MIAFRELNLTKMIRPLNDTSPRIHETAFIANNAIIIGDVEIGKNASVWFGSILRGDVNYISIGAGTNIQDGTVIHVSSKDHPTILEDRITVGHRVTLHGCYIETGCLIGIGSIILDGARIGKNSLVAAGSLVTPNTQVPPGSMVMGSPAKVKRPLTEEEMAGIRDNVESYIDLAAAYKRTQE
jgi:carbonic anhydrase/acetyltransferase-like protein (isoleucine patch superfamily)